eukprot:228739-Lingulodinium_polyedra.AAC.1
MLLWAIGYDPVVEAAQGPPMWTISPASPAVLSRTFGCTFCFWLPVALLGFGLPPTRAPLSTL